MPSRPRWHSRISDIADTLRALPDEAISATRLQALLGVGVRSAQEILKPIATVDGVGRTRLAPKEALLARLESLAGIDLEAEHARRAKFGAWLRRQEKHAETTPRLLVEAPRRLPQYDAIPGLELGPGRLSLTFQTAEEACRKLLALAMAMARDYPEFEARVAPEPAATHPKTSSPDAA